MSQHIEKSEVQTILANHELLKDFANLNNISLEVARQVLNRLLSSPKMSEETKNYVFSNKTSDDLKGFVSGQDDGYKKGHDAGFAKGVAVTAITVIGGVLWLLAKE